ncbi:endonuclease NucS domain-containing protein [Streptomyces sp. NPDC086783]|uniref:endonuclease NucS domain-containing protein n=1 Tax=Streptomyces sp. NPDC086783 TaxID=3365758 RepID=UPI00382C6EEB
MPLEFGLWRVDDKPVRVLKRPMPLESRLEELIEADPGILGRPLLLIGRQVLTRYGKVVDLLGMDAEGGLHVLELKRDRTPREVMAQAALWRTGFFANQNSACKLRARFTIEEVSRHFGIDAEIS